MATGEKIDSTTGELATLGPDRGFGKPSRKDLLYQFFENKENPVVSYGTKLAEGTDPAGNPINPVTEAAKLFIPLNAQSTYETAKDQNSLAKGIAMNVPGTFGAGVQTYGQDKTPPTKSKNASKPTTSKTGAASELKALKESAGEGYSLQQLEDGKYAYTMDGETRTTDDLADARLAIAKDEFKKSGKATKEVGGNILRRKKNGDVQVTSKLEYTYSLNQNKLEAAKRADNVSDWLKLADTQFKALQKQLEDPTLDELEKSNVQEKIDKLVADAQKYKGYGGFKKPKSGGGRGGKGKGLASAGSAYKYAVSSGAGNQVARPRVTARGGGGVRSTARRASLPKASMKKSLV
jgi:hypothetical protein